MLKVGVLVSGGGTNLQAIHGCSGCREDHQCPGGTGGQQQCRGICIEACKGSPDPCGMHFSKRL